MLRSRTLPIAALTALLAIPPASLAVEDPPPGDPDRGGDSAARAAATRTVRVADDFFSPRRLTVSRGTTIRWRWSKRNSDTHDVFLSRKPRGVRRFHSPPATRSFSYRRKLRKAGTYRILCTFHDNMRMRIDVRR